MTKDEEIKLLRKLVINAKIFKEAYAEHCEDEEDEAFVQWWEDKVKELKL